MAELSQVAAEPARARSCLLALCGLPACGKSTLSALLQEGLREGRFRTGAGLLCEGILVSFDDVHAPGGEAGAEFDPQHWKASRREALAQIEASIAQQPANGAAHRLIIADDTLHYRSMRHACRQLARDGGAAFVICWVTAPGALARTRNAARPASSRVPEHVLDRLMAVFEPPEPQAESDTCVVVAADSDSAGCCCGLVTAHTASAVHCAAARESVSTPSAPGGSSHGAGPRVSAAAAAAELWRLIWQAWGAAEAQLPSPEEIEAQRARDREITAASSVHEWDKRLRAAVAAHLARGHSADKAALARRLNDERRALLEKVRAAARRPEADMRMLDELVAKFEQQPPAQAP